MKLLRDLKKLTNSSEIDKSQGKEIKVNTKLRYNKAMSNTILSKT